MSRRRSALASKPTPAGDSAPPEALVMPAPRAPIGDTLNKDVASPQALKRLKAEMNQIRATTAAPLLKACLDELAKRRFQEAQDYALKASEIHPECGEAWYLLAICREKQRAYVDSLHCYERALALMPNHEELTLDLGRLAVCLRQPEMAEKFYARHLSRDPGSLEGANNLATVYRQQSKFTEAIELLRTYIYAHPDKPLLWNGLGAVLSEQGDSEQAITFYDEALRLDPNYGTAYHNRASCKVALGDAAGAVADCRRALELAPDDEGAGTQMRFALSCMLLLNGEIGAGWDTYEAREEPHYTDIVHFAFEGPRWAPGDDVKGKRLLVVAEQGLGDEVLFANLLPDLLADIGPEGRLMVAVEGRLVALFQRSFPEAQVVSHSTWLVNQVMIRGAHIARDEYDAWTRLGTLLRGYRRSIEAFPARPQGFLTADPERVEHWRRTLAEFGPGPKVGVLWKSLKMNAARSRFFSPFEQWRQVLDRPGVTFVNLQYGNCAEELAKAKADYGVDIVQPPGIDLKLHLDDLAALCVALDLTIGPATATTNIAAAAGAKTWFISTPDAWPRLGTNFYPWYTQARVFSATASYNWTEVMGGVAAALAETFPDH